MPDQTIYRGLINAATQTPTAPGARLRALQQRMQARRQTQGLPTPQRPRIIPRSPAPVGGGYDGSGINPSANLPHAQSSAAMQGMPPRPGQATSQNPGGIMPPHMQQGAPSTPMAGQMPQRPQATTGYSAVVPTELHPTMQAAPSRPQGVPAPPSGINPIVPGVAMPDSARAPRGVTEAAPRPVGGLMAQVPAPQY